MSKKQRFDDFDPNRYAKEAEQQWGNTRAWAESQKRAQQWTPDDQKAIQQEWAAFAEAFGARAEGDPNDPEVQELVKKLHDFINDRFYTCTADALLGLGDMYVQDERFTAFWDEVRPGTAQFVQSAIYVYCLSLLREI